MFSVFFLIMVCVLYTGYEKNKGMGGVCVFAPLHFIFPVAERTFTDAKHMFTSAKHTFTDAEHKLLGG